MSHPPDTWAKTSDARAFLEASRARIDAYLDRVLPGPEGGAPRLAEAMRYSVMAGGKRLRPALAMASCEAAGGDVDSVLPYAAALEMVHTYSLIHDDLPAMDDDDLRRGRPTSHVVFGEALAILAGDALLTHAFEVMLERIEPAEVARAAAVELAHAAGAHGMVAGQVEDVQSIDAVPDEETLLRVQGGKTAALIRASCRGGAIVAGAPKDRIDALGRYGNHVGFAFQMIDDVLDVTGTAETLGKTPGKDADEHRMTWVALEGVDATRARAQRHVGRALDAIRGLPGEPLLTALAHFVTRRDR
ncbi:MAG: polyprenyl synthetase family protein [Planctomycetota bacterium]